MSKILKYWLPPAIWMAVIFYLSSRQRIEVSEQYFFNFAIFKTLHIVEYAILYFLLFRAFLQNSQSLQSRKTAFWFAFLFSLTYSLLDEIHQILVPTRDGKLRDVLIDVVGMSLMYAYIKNRLTTIKRLL